MPRRPRDHLADTPLHIVQRGHNRDACFFAEADFLVYRDWLGEALTATVTGTSPSGTVTFKDGSTTLGTGTIASGKATFTTASLAAGSHSLTASYAGDTANNTSTSSAVSLTVNANKTSTTTSLTVSPSPATVGQMVTLAAKVTGNTPTGNITFKDGATVLGTYPINVGAGPYSSVTFSLSTTGLAAGTHSLTASYDGDTTNNSSTSSAFSLTVN